MIRQSLYRHVPYGHQNRALGGSLVTLLLLIAGTNLVGQSGIFTSHEADIWYFGNEAGLDFRGGSPTPLTNSAMVQHEGSAVAADPVTGELLFYTNGTTIWNADHEIMDGGNGLLGHRTSSQTALIIRDPGNSDRYFLFTVGAGTYVSANNNGFRYSIIDLAGDGGLGTVISKNTLLRDSTSEKLTATRHCNGRDYWVLVHDYGDPGNQFFAYLLSPDGLQEPVISQTGTPYLTGDDLQGIFKFSPDGQSLAVTSAGPQRLEFFKFDRVEGRVYDQILIDTGAHFYGLEFSISGEKLYTALLPPPGIPATLSQYDLSQGSPEQIRDSRTVLYTQPGEWQGAQLQMGPDGRIYVSFFNQPFLGVIEFPENAGTGAGFSSVGIDLQGKRTEYGLPNFIQANLFFQTAGTDLDSLTNFPCTLPNRDTVEILPECPDKDSIHLMIGNHVGSAEGDRVSVPVRVTRSTLRRRISEFTLTVTYDARMFQPEEPSTSSLTSGTLLDGWKLEEYVKSYGQISFRFRTDPPRSLPDTGILALLRFRSYLGFTDELYTLFGQQLDFGSDTCIVPITMPGRADLDLCGQTLRMMDLATGKYEVTGLQWSSNTASLSLGISTALPAPILIEVFDLTGNRIVELFHPSLPSGTHNAHVDGSSIPSGSYLVRIASGPWETVRPVTIIR